MEASKQTMSIEVLNTIFMLFNHNELERALGKGLSISYVLVVKSKHFQITYI